MTAILITALVLGLLIYGLQRNHNRTTHLYQRLPWGLDAEDHEAARFRADLRAARDHTIPEHTTPDHATSDRAAHDRPSPDRAGSDRPTHDHAA
jgi:hypothetical protein